MLKDEKLVWDIQVEVLQGGDVILTEEQVTVTQSSDTNCSGVTFTITPLRTIPVSDINLLLVFRGLHPLTQQQLFRFSASVSSNQHKYGPYEVFAREATIGMTTNHPLATADAYYTTVFPRCWMKSEVSFPHARLAPLL